MAAGDFPGMGGDPGGSPLPGQDPSVPRDVLGSFAAQQAANSLASRQRQSAFQGRLEEQATGFIEQVLTSVARSVLTTLENSGSQGNQLVTDLHRYVTGQNPPAAARGAVLLDGSPTGGGSNPPGAPVDPQNNPARQSAEAVAKAREAYEQRQAEAKKQQDEDEKAAASSTISTKEVGEQFREGREHFENATMGSVARDATKGVARFISEHNAGWFEHTDETTGQRSYRRTDGGGNVLEEVGEGDDRFNSVARRSMLAAQATRLAAGQGLSLGRLGMVAGRVAGPIGLAVGGALWAGNQLENQYEAQARYKQAFGEQDTGMFAAQERFSEFTAGLQGFGTLGNARSRANFQEASALGLRDDRREEATDFMADMFKRFGMDTNESVKLVEQAISTGVSSLSDFSDAITEVSRSAVEAGRSSQEAIQAFAAAQQAIGSNVVAGAPSVQIAQTASEISDAMPVPLSQSLGGAAGIAGLLTPQNTQLVASMTGQDPNAATWRAADPRSAAGQAGATLTGIGNLIVQQTAAVMGIPEQELRQRVRRMTGGGRPNAEQQAAIFERLCGGPQQAGVVFQSIAAYAATFGVSPDRAQILSLFFETIGGSFDAAEGGGEGGGIFGGITKAVLQGMTPEQRRDFRQEERTGVLNYQQVDSSGPSIAGSDDPASQQRNQILENMGLDQGGGMGMSSVGSLANQYIETAGRTGKGSAVIEKMLNPENQDKILQAGDASSLEDLRFQVMNKGKTENLSIDEILSNPRYYRQLANGSASVVGEGGAVTSVTSALGIEAKGKGASVGDWGTASGAQPTGSTDDPYQVRLTIDQGRIKFKTDDGLSDEMLLGIPAPGYTKPSNYYQGGGG